MCFYRFGSVHVDKPVHTYNPVHQERHAQGRSERGETSLKVFYEKASTFFSNDPIYTAVCGGKEPLREESLITGTQCPEGALQFKTVPSISTHTTLTLFACHYLGYMRKTLCLKCRKTDDSKSRTYSRIQSFVQTTTVFTIH